MRFKGAAIGLSVLIVVLAGYAYSNIWIKSFRNENNYRLQVTAPSIPIDILKVLAGEFKGMAANYLLLEAASFVGGQTKATEQDWNNVARLLTQSSALDPYFRQTYVLAQGTLPWLAQKHDETIAILKTSKKHRYWDWEPGYYLGFDHFYFLKDNATASRLLMEASRIPDAPYQLAALGTRLASQSGQTHTAIIFLKSMYASEDDETIKEQIRIRILALEGLEKLELAMVQFRQQKGRLPASLDELITHSILDTLPINPYGRPYTYQEGKIEF